MRPSKYLPIMELHFDAMFY